MFNSIWCDKHRPKTLDDIILTEENRAFFEDLKKQGTIPRLLFHGPAGIGKTSLAKIIVKDILDCQYLYINASDENGIDTIRSKVFNFAQTRSIDGKIKVIILDECLAEDTEILILRKGKQQYIKIKDLDHNNDLVKSYNIKKDQIEWKPFTLWDMGISNDIYEIEFENNEKIICTGDHKWYVKHNNKTVKMKLKDIIKNNIQEIMTKYNEN